MDQDGSKDPHDQYQTWSRTTSSKIRSRSIEGCLFGVGVGEGLAAARNGLNRRTSLRVFGRSPLEFKLLPGFGFPADQFHACCIAGQSILRSYQKQSQFHREHRKRLGWYAASHPLLATPSMQISLVRSQLGANPSGLHRPTLHGLCQTMLMTAVLQGTGVRGDAWIEGCVELKSVDPKVAAAHKLLVYATRFAIHAEIDREYAQSFLEDVATRTEDSELKEMLRKLAKMYREGWTPILAAKKLGWDKSIPNDPRWIVAMSLYCWLRNPGRFRFAVESAISLGGASSVMGAIAGGLSGLSMGKRQIPPRWLEGFVGWPHGSRWLKAFSNRLAEWPHGENDLHRAPAMPSYAILQALRSVLLTGLLGMNRLIRFPWVVMDRVPFAKLGE